MTTRTLTAEAQAERDQFNAQFGDGNCSCHLSPPCNSCTHPGNPQNQDEDESCWMPEEPVPDEPSEIDVETQFSAEAAVPVELARAVEGPRALFYAIPCRKYPYPHNMNSVPACRNDCPCDGHQTLELHSLIRQLAACSHGDPNRRKSTAGRWTTVNVPTALWDKVLGMFEDPRPTAPPAALPDAKADTYFDCGECPMVSTGCRGRCDKAT